MPEENQENINGLNSQNFWVQNTQGLNGYSQDPWYVANNQNYDGDYRQQSIQQPVQQVQQEQIIENKQEDNRNQKIYYHTSWVSKIFSWILWFMGIVLILVWILNFTQIPFFNSKKILLVWWAFILYGVWLIVLWLLFYSTKKWMHFGVSFFIAFAINILGVSFFEKYWSVEFGKSFTYFLIFTQAYFFFVTAIRIFRYWRLKKRWKWSYKMLSSTPEKKKISYIIIMIPFLILIADVIYGKILYLNIPKVETNDFIRRNHIVQLEEGKDWVAILKGKETNGEVSEIWHYLDRIYQTQSYWKEYNEYKLWWKFHHDECIKVYSWDQAICGTRVWNKKTLRRLLNHKFMKKDSYNDEYYEENWEELTVYEYIKSHEEEIEEQLNELNRLISMDYSISWSGFLFDLLPQNFQSYSRWMITLFQYYLYRWDYEKIILLAEINYKMAEICNEFWGLIWTTISVVIQGNFDGAINSSLKIIPSDERVELAEFYRKHNFDLNDIINKILIWEYELWNTAINEVKALHNKDDLWFSIVLKYFPFYSEISTRRYLDYKYDVYRKYLANEINESYYELVFGKLENKLKWSIYNMRCLMIYSSIFPRLEWSFTPIEINKEHKDILIGNLKKGDYEKWFYEPDSKIYSFYENNLIENLEDDTSPSY